MTKKKFENFPAPPSLAGASFMLYWGFLNPRLFKIIFFKKNPKSHFFGKFLLALSPFKWPPFFFQAKEGWEKRGMGGVKSFLGGALFFPGFNFLEKKEKQIRKGNFKFRIYF